MAATICDPCCNPAMWSRDTESFKQAILQSICDLIAQQEDAADGWDVKSIPDLSTTPVEVMAAAGKWGGHYIFNPNDEVKYVYLYDTATTPDVGTDAPKVILGIPYEAGANVEYKKGVTFENGLYVAAGDNPTGVGTVNAPAAPINTNILFDLAE